MTRERIVGITDTEDLKRLIRREIIEHGVCVDLNHIDVSNVGRLNGLFEDTLFNGDVSEWNITDAVTAIALFKNCPFNGDISKWNPKRLVIAESMFEGCAFNGDISKWKFEKLKHTTRMFYSSAFDRDISQWSMGSVEFSGSMFQNSQFNSDISQWQTHSMTNMRFFFAGSRFNGNIAKWNITRASQGDMHGMFLNSAFSGNLSDWTIEIHASGIHRMLDEHFRGVPPTPMQEPERNFYIEMFGTAKKFSAYLKAVPFNTAHFDMCLVNATRPVSISKEDHNWFRGLAQLGLGLGLSTTQLRAQTIAEYQKKALTNLPAEYVDLDIGELVTAA